MSTWSIDCYHLCCRRSWDFGIYVAITSSHPFRAYVYNDIVLRFCPAQYVDPVVDPAVSLTPVPSLLLPRTASLFLLHAALVDPAVSLTPLTAPSFLPFFFLLFLSLFFLYTASAIVAATREAHDEVASPQYVMGT